MRHVGAGRCLGQRAPVWGLTWLSIFPFETQDLLGEPSLPRGSESNALFSEDVHIPQPRFSGRPFPPVLPRAGCP